MQFFKIIIGAKGKIILFSLVVGLIYILPHILFIFEEGRNYHLFFKTYEDSQFYAARVREKYDGNYFSSDPYIYENKTKPYTHPFLSEYLVGTLGKISGLSIDNLFILGDFIFPVIIFYLFFYFINLFVRSIPLALLGSMAILLAEIPDSLTALVKLKLPVLFLTFNRPISPQFHYLFFVSCLIFIYKSLADCKIVNILFSGIFLGLLFYMYPYFWIYIFMSLVVLSFYLVSKRQFKHIKIIFFICIEALIISIPFWINYLKLMPLPIYHEIMTRLTLQKSHHIIIEKLSISALVLFILFYKNKDYHFFFLFSCLLSGLLCMNQQALSGWTFEPEHWHYYVNKQTAVVAGIVLLDNFLKKARFKGRFIKFISTIGLAFSISIGVSIQIYNYEKNRYIQSRQQHLYEAFVWLENNTDREDVVLASDAVSLLLPIHTHNNIYWSSYIFSYANSDKDILERFFLLARLLGMDENEVMDYILTRTEKGHSDFFGARYAQPTYRKSNKKARVNLPQDLYDYIIQRYRIFKKEDIRMHFSRFRIDYLFFSPYEQLLSKGRFKRESFLDKVYDYQGIQIYRIVK